MFLDLDLGVWLIRWLVVRFVDYISTLTPTLSSVGGEMGRMYVCVRVSITNMPPFHWLGWVDSTFLLLL